MRLTNCYESILRRESIRGDEIGLESKHVCHGEEVEEEEEEKTSKTRMETKIMKGYS